MSNEAPDNPPMTEDRVPAEWKQTLEVLCRRIEQEPDNAFHWATRGILLRSMHDYQGAAHDFEQALHLDPNSAYALRSQIALYLATGQHSAAIAAAKKAIALEPENGSNYVLRGRVCLEEGRLAEAILDFTRAMELRPGWALPYFYRARTHTEEGAKGYQEALADYDTFFRLERECTEMIGWVHGLRAFVYLRLRRYREAIADLDERLRLTPSDAHTYLIRSRAHALAGDRTQAAEDRAKAMELDPGVLDS